MSSRFDGKVALVTGGASGIGEACARLLAERGARVVVNDIDRARAEQVAGEVSGLAIMADVSDEHDVERMTEEAEREFGAIDILVANAGVLQAPLPPEELSLADWDRVVAVDQRGVYLSCRSVGGRMAKRGRGSIITIASIAGMRSMPLHSYAPAKAAVISMTQCLATEWGRSGVRVNAVAPGYTLTPALQEAIDSGRRDPAALAETSALGRLIAPHEIALAVAFLASDEAAAITGIALPVDAGWLVGPSWQTYGGIRPART